MSQSSEKPHSKIGITSFIFSMLSPFSFVCIFLFLIIGGKIGVDAAFASFWVSVGSSIMAFALGLTTFFQKTTKRIFGILGFVFGLLETTAIGLSTFLLIKFLDAAAKAIGGSLPGHF